MSQPTCPNFTKEAKQFSQELTETMNTAFLGISLFCISNDKMPLQDRLALGRILMAEAVLEINKSLILNMPNAVYADRKPANPRVPQPSVN